MYVNRLLKDQFNNSSKLSPRSLSSTFLDQPKVTDKKESPKQIDAESENQSKY